MRCLKCKARYRLKNLLVNSSEFKNIFYCSECNRIEQWKKKRPNTTLRYIYSTPTHYQIDCYDPNLYRWCEKNMQDAECLYKITLHSGEIIHVFPKEIKNDYLVGKRDLWYNGAEDMFHTEGDEEIIIPIDLLKCIDVIDKKSDYIEPNIKEPIYGYKGVTVENEKISCIGYIYDIGVPYIEKKKGNPYAYNYDDCYSHFCLEIEEPLLYWDRDYVSSYVMNKEKNRGFETKLYRVKAEEHCRQNSEHGWVSNHLTVIEEVSKKAIIEYYENNPVLLNRLRKYWENKNEPNDLWERYKAL